jgi:aconitate hydratase 2/2-methylisocitrate dehydratase
MQFIEDLKKKGNLVAYVGDVVGTGSSRKSATNSVIWATGQDIPFVPNKRFGGVTPGRQDRPHLLQHQEDSGALPIEVDVSKLEMGDVIDVLPYDGKIVKNGEPWPSSKLKSEVLFDEVRAGGRINLIIGRSPDRQGARGPGPARLHLFRLPQAPAETRQGFTLAQKMVGRACGLPEGQGVRPGTYCEPRMTTVGSQDTTGPMTRDELKDLACLGFSADLVMQSFCHTAAYPKPVDVKTHRELPEFISNRGGVALRPGDGVIHSWLNRLLLPDTVGTGGDSHTRFPIGISLPRRLRPGGLRRRHRRDAAGHARIGAGALQGPDAARRHAARPGARHSAVRHQGRSADRGQGRQEEHLLGPHPGNRRPARPEGGAGVRAVRRLGRALCRRLHHQAQQEPIIEYLKSNIVLMKNMIADGYADAKHPGRRIERSKPGWPSPSCSKPTRTPNTPP